jgi:hypothetical protein
MSLFTTDYSHNEDTNFKPLPEGDYEVIIEKAGQDATKGGTEYLSVNYRVRKDLDKAMPETNGKYHNRIIFGSFWKRKDTGKYNDTDVNRLMSAAGVPSGTQIKDWDDFSDKLVGKPVRIHVTIDSSEYNGKTTERNQVASWNISQTEYPLQQADPFADAKGNDTELSDEDVPF